jgi:hypothetical protein
MAEILIPKIFRLSLPTPSEFAEYYSAFSTKEQRRRLAEYLELLNTAEERGDLVVANDIPDDGYFTADISNPNLLRPLMEIGATLMTEIIEALAPDHPELEPFLELDDQLIPYGCIIDQHRFQLLTILNNTYLTITK